jgi:phosphoglycerate dehydrogenase-like enzyme
MAHEKIVLTHSGQLKEGLLATARRAAPVGYDLQILPGTAKPEEIATAIHDAEYLLGYVEYLPDEAFAEARKLKLVQVISAGYDLLNVEGIKKAGIPLCTNGGANAVAVAEHTILLILAVYRQLVASHESVTSGRWMKGVSMSTLFELDRKTVGIVGLGNIGRCVAERVRPFGAKVIYTDVAQLPSDVEERLGVTYLPLDGLLEQSDVVSLHMPLNDATRGMIGAAAFARMKPTAILINTCRGEIVDEPALVDALKTGRLLGAGLDTVAHEPPDPDDPILNAPNVTLTPHTAGPTVDSFEKRFINGFANIERVARGERPLWIIPEMRDTKLRID